MKAKRMLEVVLTQEQMQEALREYVNARGIELRNYQEGPLLYNSPNDRVRLVFYDVQRDLSP